jgi:uncharacterized protein YfiM (DUF2279 family)
MRGFLLVFSLHFGGASPTPDPWFSIDKAKHFVTAAFVQTAAFSTIRSTGVGRNTSLAGAAVVASGVSVGKELYDRKFGGDPSVKDLAWDVAGMVASAALLRRTER